MTDLGTPVPPAPAPGTPPSAPRKVATPEEREHAIVLSREGMGNKQIAVQLNLHGHLVNSIINGARRTGQLPPTEKALHKIQMGTSATMEAPSQISSPYLPQENSRMSKPPLRPQIQHPAPSQPTLPDDFTGGTSILGVPGGFTGSKPVIKYTVERIAPQDGVLGTHYGSFGVEELGKTYGQGVYKITRHDPSKPVAQEFTQQIGASYGETRFPNNMGSSRPQHRPFSNFGRPPMDRSQPEDGAVQSPYRPMYPRIEDFGRHQPTQSGSGVEKAIEMMSQMADKSFQQVEAARKASPDAHLSKIFESQQEMMQLRFEQERQREIERREADEAKWERARQEDRDRWDREQASQKAAHDRELARIKAENDARLAEARAAAEERDRRDRQDREDRDKRLAEERKHFLEIEDKRLALMREEADIKQKRLESEIGRTREEMVSIQKKTTDESRETREATARHIEESNRALAEQLERDREALDREYKLKEKAQEREHELQREMLSLQKENIEKSGGDQAFNMINTVIKEFSKGVGQYVDLKKMEAMAPEAQVAAIANGNTMGGAQQAEASPAPAQQPPVAPRTQQAPAPAAEAPKPEAPSVITGIVENKMESMIRENLQKPFFQDVLNEWAAHVDSCAETGQVDATTFANLYMVMMQDTRNEEGRQGCAAFATFMKPRNWKKMYSVLKGALKPEVRESFERPEAVEFYEQFRTLIITHIQDYFEQFMAGKVAQKQGAQPAAPQQAQAPVEPQGAPAQSQEQAPPAPVPTRESLRQAAEAAGQGA